MKDIAADGTDNRTAKQEYQQVEATWMKKPGEQTGETGRKAFIVKWLRAYGAALVSTGVILPVIISIITVGIYFSLPFMQLQAPVPNWYSVITGMIVTYAFWLLISIFFLHFTTALGANARSYYLIRCRMDQLQARLDYLESCKIDAESSLNLSALQEARVIYADLGEIMRTSPTGLRWVLATGYINAWNMIHRVEEALIEVEPVTIVLQDAIHDKLALQGSSIKNNNELLSRLLQAMKDLDPLALSYFSENQPDKSRDELLNKLIQATSENSNVLKQLVQVVTRLDHSIKIDVPETNLEDGGDTIAALPITTSPATQARARVALREIRRALNSYRDSIWEKLVRSRNQLLGAIAMTGIVTHTLLCIAILTGTTPDSTIKPQIIAAVVYYIVGAIAGLFGRFYKEITSNSDIDDYGLAATRLIATPLLSGLAGVGGVLITALLYTTLSASSSITLLDIFLLREPRYMLAAAIFGLTPNLIIRSLQQKAEKYTSDLQSSKSSPTIDGTDA